MIRCFLTGVQISIDDAFVLNRRDTHDLLAALKERLASLQRVIEQFSPLDEGDALVPTNRHPALRRKRHRLACKAAADMLATGFPEVQLFLPWPEYRQRSRSTMQRNRSIEGSAAAEPRLDSAGAS